MEVPQTTELKVTKFLHDKFPLTRKRRLEATTSLLESGIVDSIGVLEIVTFIEQEFPVQVSDEDLVPENFGSIAAIVSFVQRRLEEATISQ